MERREEKESSVLKMSFYNSQKARQNEGKPATVMWIFCGLPGEKLVPMRRVLKGMLMVMKRLLKELMIPKFNIA